MKKLKNVGIALSNAEQKTINGGRLPDLSSACGYVLFNSVQSQCLGLAAQYQPLWNASTGTCSALGQGTNCEEVSPIAIAC